VAAIPNQISFLLPCPGGKKRTPPREREPSRRESPGRETEAERRGGEAEARRRRRVPAMERCHPSEVYELFVRHMNTPR